MKIFIFCQALRLPKYIKKENHKKDLPFEEIVSNKNSTNFISNFVKRFIFLVTFFVPFILLNSSVQHGNERFVCVFRLF